MPADRALFPTRARPCQVWVREASRESFEMNVLFAVEDRLDKTHDPVMVSKSMSGSKSRKLRFGIRRCDPAIAHHRSNAEFDGY